MGGLVVSPVGLCDEFDGDDEGDGEGELGEPVFKVAVGVAAELPVVGGLSEADSVVG